MKHKKLATVIAIANQKGGVGKTTSCINLVAALAMMDKNLLLIDLDPQGNASTGLGLDKTKLTYSSDDVLMGRVSMREAIIANAADGIDVLPATISLADGELDLAAHEQATQVLAIALKDIRQDYDYIFIDCPPSRNLLTINALAAANRVMITLQTEFYAMEGLTQLMDSIRQIKDSVNQGLSMDGIVLTMVDRRNNLSRQVEQDVRDYFGYQVYQQTIPRNIRLAEAPSYGTSIFEHALRSPGAQAYLQLAHEFLDREHKNMEVSQW